MSGWKPLLPVKKAQIRYFSVCEFWKGIQSNNHYIANLLRKMYFTDFLHPLYYFFLLKLPINHRQNFHSTVLGYVICTVSFKSVTFHPYLLCWSTCRRLSQRSIAIKSIYFNGLAEPPSGTHRRLVEAWPSMGRFQPLYKTSVIVLYSECAGCWIEVKIG